MAQTNRVLIGDDAERNRHFLESDHVEGEGDRRIVWRVVTLARKSVIGAQSTRTRQEFDCAKPPKMRDLFVVHYTGIQGTGQILFSLAAPDLSWREVPAEGFESKVQAAVCGLPITVEKFTTSPAKPPAVEEPPK